MELTLEWGRSIRRSGHQGEDDGGGGKEGGNVVQGGVQSPGFVEPSGDEGRHGGHEEAEEGDDAQGGGGYFPPYNFQGRSGQYRLVGIQEKTQQCNQDGEGYSITKCGQ